ncbi:phosphoglycerate mutase-like protein [Apiospora sp. TS-2023a]
MPATIWLIRHGEAYHNVTHDWTLRDPELTDKGRKQAEDFYHANAHIMSGKVAAIFASPSIRTIQTAYLCFYSSVRQGKAISLNPDLMECTPEPPETCNIPRTQNELLDIFGTSISVASIGTQDYMDRGPTSRFREEPEAWRARAARARETIFRYANTLPDDAIIGVVSHYHLLDYLVGGGGGELARGHWKNCEMRSYRFQFDPYSLEREYHLVSSNPFVHSRSHLPSPPPDCPTMSSPLPEGGPSNLRSILTRVHGEDGHGDDPRTRKCKAPRPKKAVTFDENLQLQVEWTNLVRREFTVPANLSPEFQYNLDRLNDMALLRARQLRRYASIYPNHGFPDQMLEQAEVLQPEAWWAASAHEELWPKEWHPDQKDMKRYMARFCMGWRELFPNAGV